MQKNTSKNRILNYLKNKDNVSIGEFVEVFGLSRQAIHLQLKKLLENDLIIKKGSSPKVFYSLNKDSSKINLELSVSEEIKKVINDNFLLIEPTGVKSLGVPAFISWCQKRNFEPGQKALEYFALSNKYNKLKQKGLLKGNHKIKNSFKTVYLDDIFYIDFYSWEIFGKTKLGQLLLYAKQSQNTKIMNQLIEEIKDRITKLISEEKIDAVAFVPPTVKRETQFMKVLEKKLNLNLPIISITKIKSEIMIPQKTLSKIEDRIENAESTIVVTEKRKGFKKVLLLDDAVGSGATFNSIAQKIKKGDVSSKVIALAITGSLKGFDVISEV